MATTFRTPWTGFVRSSLTLSDNELAEALSCFETIAPTVRVSQACQRDITEALRKPSVGAFTS